MKNEGGGTGGYNLGDGGDGGGNARGNGRNFEMNSNLSVLKEFKLVEKSVFLMCNEKIEIDSVYDNVVEPKNKTRFSNVPTKPLKNSKNLR